MAHQDPLVVGTQDTYRLRFVERRKDAVTGIVVETARDLTLDQAVRFNAWLDRGDGKGLVAVAGSPFALDKDADQEANTGYADRRWVGTEFAGAGILMVRPEVVDANGKVHHAAVIFETVQAVKAQEAA